jgi:hypothetical protein
MKYKVNGSYTRDTSHRDRVIVMLTGTVTELIILFCGTLVHLNRTKKKNGTSSLVNVNQNK